MKWLIAGILLYLTRHSEAGALKCTPNSQDLSCVSEKRAISPVQTLIELERERRSADTQCLAGSEWESNCHKCRCSDEGIAVCLKQDNCDLKFSEEPIKCKPFTSFRRDCNTCTCLENGHGLCTLKGCFNLERRKREMQCQPGSTWKNSCNNCMCHSSGLATCTRKGCFNDTENSLKVCAPGTEWKSDCNTCHCTAEGQPSCTEIKCNSIESTNILRRETPVEPKSEAKQTSSNNTKPTKRVVCVANRMFIMDCNTCWCNEDGTSFFCTRKVCVQDGTDENTTDDPDYEVKLRVVPQECRPNEVFEMDCNMCRCNADGKSFSCTRRACVEVHDKNSKLTRQTRAAQEPPKACQPGQEFRMDCNKCLCNDEGKDFSCTRIDCTTINGNGGGDTFTSARTKRDLSEKIETKCVAGSVFDRGCNVCACTEDGMHATCTLKVCKQPQEANDTTTESTLSFRCTPGDQFRRDCNDCTCSADGKTVFCTLRLCDQDQVSIIQDQVLSEI